MFTDSDNFQLLSYVALIQTWLKTCPKETVEHPLLCESISQYIEQITHTGQSKRYMAELKQHSRQDLLTGNKPVSLLDDILVAKKSCAQKVSVSLPAKSSQGRAAGHRKAGIKIFYNYECSINWYSWPKWGGGSK